MHLSRFPRRCYTPAQTPIEYLPHLSKHLGGPNIWIKRDDMTGLTGGGNKTRKLEFLVADALSQGCDTLITTGAVQSNHCRLTLAAAVKEGLKCRLVLEQRVAGSYDAKASGNNFLFDLLNVEMISVVDSGADIPGTMRAISDQLAQEGRKGYIIPGGGSNALGALGYVACAEEILAQTFALNLVLDHVICTSGSAGTHAGLVVGLHGNNAQISLSGVSCRHTRELQESTVYKLAQQTVDLLKLPGVSKETVRVHGDWVGPGYSLPTQEMIEAVRLVARLEGILLDPVYTGKAMAGLIGLIRRGDFQSGQNVLFVHTGGSPALYAYQSMLQS